DDLGEMFDGFMIDLTNIGAGDRQSPDKVELIKLFDALLNGQSDASVKLSNLVPESTSLQYQNGL
ncbi:hypothetical protein, partial [Shewanella colwelliana]